MTGRPDLFDRALEIRTDYSKRWIQKTGIPVKRGLRKLLTYLQEKQIPAALATSTERDIAIGYLCMAGVDSCFAASVCGFEVERSKPEPDIFLKTAEKLTLLPEECLVLEDSENGLRAAKASGCLSIVVLRG